jgi:hypothetical protein
MTARWEERPVEVANLLNPAFLGAILRKAIDGYVEHSREGMPYEVAFLVPAFALHPNTARRLPPRAASTPLHMWLQRDENRDVLIAFAARITALVPFVREALIYAMQRKVIEITETGRLKPGPKNLSGITAFRRSGDEAKEGLRLGEFTGKWFSLAGSTATVFTLLGVRP